MKLKRKELVPQDEQNKRKSKFLLLTSPIWGAGGCLGAAIIISIVATVLVLLFIFLVCILFVVGTNLALHP